MKLIYVGMCADPIHHGHINILRIARDIGRVVVGLLTDEAMESYKRKPILTWAQRRAVVGSIRGVEQVIPQHTLDYTDNLLDLKPDYVLHSDGWRDDIQAHTRNQVIRVLKNWGGTLLETPHTDGISSTQIVESLQGEINDKGF